MACEVLHKTGLITNLLPSKNKSEMADNFICFKSSMRFGVDMQKILISHIFGTNCKKEKKVKLSKNY